MRPRLAQFRSPMVPIRNTMPMTMSTTGPATDRLRRGATIGAGLDIFHLVDGRLRLSSIAARGRRRWIYGSLNRRWCRVARSGGATLKQFHYSDHEDEKRPSTVPAEAAHTVQQRENADGHQDSRPHQAAGTASIAIAARLW